jgi:GNAT superfamily N-acetyltransferase
VVEVAAGLTVWRIRRAEVADAAALARINVAGWRASYAGVVPAEFLAAMDAPERLERWQRAMGEPEPFATFVAVDEHDMIGAYCRLGPLRTVDDGVEPEAGELRAIYADPARQGTGAGRAVHDAGVEYLREQGYHWAGLWVFTANTSARAWYSARGWAPDGATHEDEIMGTVIPEMRYARTFL